MGPIVGTFKAREGAVGGLGIDGLVPISEMRGNERKKERDRERKRDRETDRETDRQTERPRC